MTEDYYIILGVSKGASPNNIKKAYRKVIKQLHPDVNRSKAASNRFLHVQEAYETLSDESKRRQYDDQLRRHRVAARTEPINTIRPQRELGRATFDRYTSRTDEFFEGFLPGFFFEPSRGIGEKDLYVEVILTPDEASRGGLFPLTIPVFERCPDCAGADAPFAFWCRTCGGGGRIRGERSVSLSIPPHTRHGTETTVSMEDVGLAGILLTVRVYIDPDAH